MYRLMNGVEGAESCWVWDYQIQDFAEEGFESAWSNYCDGDDPLDQVDVIVEAIKEDQKLFRLHRSKNQGDQKDSNASENAKKRKREDGEDSNDEEPAHTNGKDNDGDGEEDGEEQSNEGSESDESGVSVDEEELLFGDWRPDGACRADDLAGTPWDVSILIKRYMSLGLYDAEFVFNAVDLYTGKLVYLTTNSGYGPRSTGDTVWERFERMAREIGDDDFYWISLGLEIESDEEDDEDGDEAAPPPPFTRVESEAGETFAELQDRVGITAPKGGALYRVTKTESVSNTKLLVLYNTSTQEYQTEGVRETLKLNPAAKSVSVKPAMIPSGYELYVSSTSYNRKLAGGPVLLKTGDGNAGSDNNDDDDMDE